MGGLNRIYMHNRKNYLQPPFSLYDAALALRRKSLPLSSSSDARPPHRGGEVGTGGAGHVCSMIDDWDPHFTPDLYVCMRVRAFFSPPRIEIETKPRQGGEGPLGLLGARGGW